MVWAVDFRKEKQTCTALKSGADAASLASLKAAYDAAELAFDTAAETSRAKHAPQLDAALAELGPADRTAIVLRFLQGYSLKEVAVALAASEDAAKKRISRAIDKLRLARHVALEQWRQRRAEMSAQRAQARAKRRKPDT